MVTATMPQTIPAMVSRLRTRRRVSAPHASWMICRNIALASRLIAQGFDGVDGCRPLRGIERAGDRDGAEQAECKQRGIPGGQQAGKKCRHRKEIKDRAETEGQSQ